MKHLLIKSSVLTIFVALAVAATVYALRPQFAGIRAGKADENYLKSTDCLVCHENHYASWRETHHSRMTQNITPSTVQGDFERENTLEYLNVKAVMQRRGAEFWMNFAYADGKKESFKIERTVGSRRIEQYVAKTNNGQYFRLPVAYDLTQKRWMNLNGSFFYPDGDNFNQHTAQWDTNCVFCHNVKAQPNFNFQTKLAKTEVSELGIACGACHGQGAEHAELAASPLTRTLWHSDANAETKIVNPLKIDSDRALMVCGHCHGQRIPEPQTRITEILSKGDPFDAGEDLSKLYRPIHRETTIGNVSFANRFWADGSPRLTAYEYQGLTASKCFLNGEKGNRINCLSCHTMHEGDVNGQLTADKKTNLACTQCHQQLNNPDTLALHTKHTANSEGSSCDSCHTPQVVYGVMSFHPSHQITVPNPELTAQKQVPNACNQCHVDKSVNWAIEQTKTLWTERYKNAQTSTDEQFNFPEGVRGLFAGDALTRALSANALAEHSDINWSAPFLLQSLTSENYPVVRYFAANGLTAAHWNLPKPDYLADKTQRDQTLVKWLEKIDSGKLKEAQTIAEKLRQKRKDSDLEVGE